MAGKPNTMSTIYTYRNDGARDYADKAPFEYTAGPRTGPNGEAYSQCWVAIKPDPPAPPAELALTVHVRIPSYHQPGPSLTTLNKGGLGRVFVNAGVLNEKHEAHS